MDTITKLPLELNRKQRLRLAVSFETELIDNIVPFWETHSPDAVNGGYFSCLDQKGSVYDTRKYAWMLGRQSWMFGKLYSEVIQRQEWLILAKSGVSFLRDHALRDDGRVYFSMTKEGAPVYLQRKIFSECFYAAALGQYGRASGEEIYCEESRSELDRILEWAYDWTKVGRPALPGQPASRMLAVPMILLNLIEEVDGLNTKRYYTEAEDCINRILLHVDHERKVVRENVSLDGSTLEGPDGRLMNPGHAIEAGWFLLHWALFHGREDWKDHAVNIIRWSHMAGWDAEFGGYFSFLDADGHSPAPLEWHMKFWWPHTEALYSHLLAYRVTGNPEDLANFQKVYAYIVEHFPDREHGEWFGYLDRLGNPTHTFKGGIYKGFFHIPRALHLCQRLLENWDSAGGLIQQAT